MKTRTVLIALLGTGMFLCECVEAQFVGRRANIGGVRTRFGRWYASPGYGVYGGYYSMPAQTPYSAALREQSQVIAAQGIATKNRAQAALAYEQAREQYIANSKQWNAVLAERRRAKAARDAQKKADQAVRAEKNRQRPKPVRQPTPPLSSRQLDRATGEITWPEEFMGQEFATDRREVESLLKVIANGAASTSTTEALSDATSRMRKIVGTNAREYGFQKYAAMKKFLVSLAAEGTSASSEVPVLVQQVGSDASDKHFDAIMKLGTMGPEAVAAVPALTKALSSDDPVIQNQAIITLGEIGLAANSAESAVSTFLDNDSPILQHSAIESLRKMGSSSADVIGRLRVLAKNDEPLTSVAAVWALAVLDPNSDATIRESIPRLIEALGNKESHIRNDASIALAGIGSPAVQPLLAALEKGDQQVQLKVCEALKMIGPPAKQALPALVGLLNNQDLQIARQAALALGNIGPEAEAGVPGIIGLLDHREPGVRTDAAHALAGIGAGSKLAVTSLTELLKDKDSGVRMAAATALGNIGPDAGAASDSLVAALGDSVGGVTISAASALAQIGTPAVSAVASKLKDKDYRELATLILGQMGPAAAAAVPGMVELLGDADQDFAREVLVALATIGPDAAKATPRLMQLMNDADAGQLRRSAVYALAKIGAKEAIPSLQRIAQESKDEKLLVAASWAMVHFDPTNSRYASVAIPHLKKALANEWDLVRQEAALAIGQVGEAGIAASAELTKAAGDESPAVRAEALRSLVEVGADADTLLPLAVKALDDEDSTVRNTGRYALGKLGGQAAVAAPRLRESLRLGAPMDRLVSVWALVQVAPSAEVNKTAIPHLIEGLQYPRPSVRTECAKMLGNIGAAAGGVREALTVAAKDQDAEVRKAATDALAALK